MAIWRRKKSDPSVTEQPYVEEGKVDYQGNAPYTGEGYEEPHIDGQPSQTKLHRGLKARHITMIAIGGAIGTGLIIGTGKALAQAGPASILISYTFVGLIVFMVMAALGEMDLAWNPNCSLTDVLNRRNGGLDSPR
jgi:amino acid transporter